MAKKMRTPEERTIDPAAQQMLIRADEIAVGTAFSRADKMSPCNIGAAGMCCKICGMGPCRLTKEGDTGVCGATIDTIQARNLIRAIAAGAAAHSDHGRDMAFTLKAVANGKTEGYRIRDVAKLRIVAQKYGIEIEGRPPEEIADELADLYISQFGQQKGEVVVVNRAPEKRLKLWRELGVVPRGIDREVVEALHRTHIGDDQDPEHILNHAVRTALGDGWGGSLLEEAKLSGDPKLLTVAAHTLAPEEAPTGSDVDVNEFEADLDDKDFRVRVTRRVLPEAGKISLTDAKIVVSGGRGVGSKDGFASLEALAELMGGAVGASRAVTNLGWRTHADQIGQTGTRIAPHLYIACGVSGAIQHMVGCKGAKHILAINTDPEAPIIAKADYAIIGDLHEVVPALVAEISEL